MRGNVSVQRETPHARDEQRSQLFTAFGIEGIEGIEGVVGVVDGAARPQSACPARPVLRTALGRCAGTALAVR